MLSDVVGYVGILSGNVGKCRTLIVCIAKNILKIPMVCQWNGNWKLLLFFGAFTVCFMTAGQSNSNYPTGLDGN
jgi:hypothetical protein